MKQVAVFAAVALFLVSSVSFGSDAKSFRIEDKKNEIASLLVKKKGKKTVNLKKVLLRPTLDHFRFAGVVEFKYSAGVLSGIARDIENYEKWIRVASKKGAPVIFEGIKGSKAAGLVTIYFTSSMLGKKVKLVYPLNTSVIP
ncbi:MAG: hypothetical protein FJ088_07195, partial [Deltaproteobacteria bacterium]|nr:hypothetical protein [Deltaproteobacteria bacterium]